MSTIEELIKLQNYDVIEARPLTVRGQYSKNTNVDINKTIQSVSLLTQDLNNFNSSVPESSLNTGAAFSLKEWAQQTAKEAVLSLNPTKIVTNPNPLSKKLTLTNDIIVSVIQLAINQQDIILNKLEDQVLKILEKQNNVKIVKDENGNITVVPILTENAQKALNNVTKLLSSTIITLDKINTRVSNENPIKNIDDFVNNLSIKHLIKLAQLVISILITIKLIQITIRKTRDAAIAANAAAQIPVPNIALATEYTERATIILAEERLALQDLGSAKEIIGVFEDQILYYQEFIQLFIDRIKEILELIKTIQLQSGTLDNQSSISNSQIQELINKLDKIIIDQQQVQDKITKKTLEPEFVRTNKPYYAARIIR